MALLDKALVAPSPAQLNPDTRASNYRKSTDLPVPVTWLAARAGEDGSDRRGASSVGRAWLAGGSGGDGGGDLPHARAPDSPRPRRVHPAAVRSDLRPLRGPHAAVLQSHRRPAHDED